MVKVLFVCMGNICRSPMAQGVFEDLVRREGLEGEISVDSAGTGAWHIGYPPDPRARQSAGKRGLDLSAQRARRIEPDDCGRFDYIITMDEDNYRTVSGLCNGAGAEIKPLLDYAPDNRESEVPDPYYAGDAGFEYALDLIEAAAGGLLQSIRGRHLSRHV